MTRETCATCGKPLGNTVERCFEHGGRNYRAGPTYNGLIAYLLRGGL